MSEGRVFAGRYQLISQLGVGGMGSVWRARDLTLDADVAVKLIDPALGAAKEAVERFRREAKAAAAIRSTHVVQILDYGVDRGTPFIAMELLQGEDLGQRLERLGALGPETTAHILGQVARALELAHARGIVHRDLKPDNIFLVREGDEDLAKVLDFGIARRQGGLDDSSGLRTKTGALMGTPYYMSPEQATGQPVDHRTDIWSFGIIASECLTGQRVFRCDSLGALFHAICMAPMPVPSELGPVPQGFDAWFARAAARDREARFASIREAADELKTILLGHASGPPSVVARPAGLGNIVAVASVATEVSPGEVARPRPDRTAPPSSRSILGLTRSGRPAIAVVALSTLALGGLWLGVRWVDRSAPAASSGSSVEGASSPESWAPSEAAAPPVSTEVTPVPVEAADGGRAIDTPERAASAPSAAFPWRGLSTTPVKKTPAAPSAQRPTRVPEERYENAAGI